VKGKRRRNGEGDKGKGETRKGKETAKGRKEFCAVVIFP